MYLMDALIILENAYSERLYNVIVGIIDMILEGWLVFPPHDISQLEPQLLLKVGEPLQSSDGVSQSFDIVHLGPSP